jgi:hypothetical protein
MDLGFVGEGKTIEGLNGFKKAVLGASILHVIAIC